MFPNCDVTAGSMSSDYIHGAGASTANTSGYDMHNYLSNQGYWSYLRNQVSTKNMKQDFITQYSSITPSTITGSADFLSQG